MKWVMLSIGVVVIIASLVAIFIVPWPDANRQRAEQVARTAGIPAGVTPGPPP